MADQNEDKSDSIESLCSKPKILLIDLENCPNQLKELQKRIAEYSQVVICYAHSSAKIPLDWLMPLNETINADRLKIYKMVASGKNSADFGICFFAGMLMQQMPEDSHFVIMSNDTDLDHVVNLLNSQNRTAERLGVKTAETAALSVVETVENKLSPIEVYCSHLVAYKKNRPAKKVTLLNSIKNKFKDKPEITNSILESLIKKGALSIQENKVIYNDKKVIELSLNKV
ncbi:MAG: NYN domain-containing protein [Desulfamplus sp.]|nr:NYN domain-containing protein [Desulfamplus sp.]